MKRREFVKRAGVISTGFSFTGYSNRYQRGAKVSQGKSERREVIGISIIAPSTIQINEKFDLHIRILTEPYFTTWWGGDDKFNKSPRGTFYMKNVVPDWNGTVQINGPTDMKGVLEYKFENYENDNGAIRKVGGFSFDQPGIKEIGVVDRESGLFGVSNPIVVSKDPMTDNLYWGDLHCHSFFGDGIRSPEDLTLFARDEARLDVFSLTEHTDLVTDDQWKYLGNVANRFNESGKFVTLIGGEWTSKTFGHRNFIYPHSEGPIIRTSNPQQDDLSKLFSIVGENDGLVIANHPNLNGFPIKFGDYPDDFSVERLVEVYSTGGSYELPSSNHTDKNLQVGDSVVDGLNLNHRLGLVGSGDTHDGRPGDSLSEYQIKPESYKSLKKPGIMGIWAEKLTRESIFEALWNRNVYGTTNNRTILKFSINGYRMGSIIQLKASPIIVIEVISDLTIERVELVREGDVAQNIQPKDKSVMWEPLLHLENINQETWFYVKVSLKDGNFAWSSPIWVKIE